MLWELMNYFGWLSSLWSLSSSCAFTVYTYKHRLIQNLAERQRAFHYPADHRRKLGLTSSKTHSLQCNRILPARSTLSIITIFFEKAIISWREKIKQEWWFNVFLICMLALESACWATLGKLISHSVSRSPGLWNRTHHHSCLLGCCGE